VPINVPLARWASTVMPAPLSVHMGVDGPGDGPVSAPHLVQVDHRRALAVMPHAGHQILDARAAGCRQRIAGVAKIVEEQAPRADLRRRMSAFGNQPSVREFQARAHDLMPASDPRPVRKSHAA
jgi:hypothetical protein